MNERETERWKTEIGDKEIWSNLRQSEYGETENGVNDLKRRKRSGFVGV